MIKPMKDLTENSVIKMNEDGQPVVSSLDIAKAFDRQHKNVLAAIKGLTARGKVNLLDFKQVEYTARNGQKQPRYDLTERGFLVACPFIGGEKALEGQIVIVDEFMSMRDKLSKKLSPMEMVIASATAIIALEEKQQEQDARIVQLEDKAAHTNHIFHFGDYTSIKAYCNVNKIRLTTSLASKIGKVCTKHCKEYGVRMGRLPCPVYGEVNSYPEDVIKQILMENDFS